MKVGAQKAKWKAFGLVRDKNGRPKIDNLSKIPKEIWDMLTPEEQEEITHGKERTTLNGGENGIGDHSENTD